MALDINLIGILGSNLPEGEPLGLPDFSGMLAAVVTGPHQGYFREWKREFQTFLNQFEAKHDALCTDLAFAGSPNVSQEVRLSAIVSASGKIAEMRADLANQIKKIDDLLCERGGQLNHKQKETLTAIRNTLVTEDSRLGQFEFALNSIRGRIPVEPLTDSILAGITNLVREVSAWLPIQEAKDLVKNEMSG